MQSYAELTQLWSRTGQVNLLHALVRRETRTWLPRVAVAHVAAAAHDSPERESQIVFDAPSPSTPPPPPPLPPTVCAHCGKQATAKCSRCKAEKYCSRQCQADSWHSHKAHCVRVPADRSMAAVASAAAASSTTNSTDMVQIASTTAVTDDQRETREGPTDRQMDRETERERGREERGKMERERKRGRESERQREKTHNTRRDTGSS